MPRKPRTTPQRSVDVLVSEGEWVEPTLFPLTDDLLECSPIVRVEISANLLGPLGIVEVGYTISDITNDRTLAMAHNVRPGLSVHNSSVFLRECDTQYRRGLSLLLPF